MKKIICTIEEKQVASSKSKTIFKTKEIINEENILVERLNRDKHYNFKYLGKNENNQLLLEIENYWSIPFVFFKNQDICEVTVKDGNSKCN